LNLNEMARQECFWTNLTCTQQCY